MSSNVNNENCAAAVTEEETECPICMCDIKKKSHPDTCMHLFCFECLKKWSNTKKVCPLCKRAYNSIYHLNESNQYEHIYTPSQVPFLSISEDEEEDEDLANELDFGYQDLEEFDEDFSYTGIIEHLRNEFIWNSPAGPEIILPYPPTDN